MKVPKRIEQNATAKDNYLTEREASLNKALMNTQTLLAQQLSADVMSKINVKDERITDTPSNYMLLTGLPIFFKNFEKESQRIIAPEIDNTITKLADYNNKYYKASMGEKLPTNYAEVAKRIEKKLAMRLGMSRGQIVSGSFLESLIRNDNLLMSVKNYISSAVASQETSKVFLSTLMEMVMGNDKKDGAYVAQFKRFAHDIYMQYDRLYSNQVAADLGMRFFLYLGGIIKDSRDMCVAHNNRVVSKYEAEDFVNWKPVKGTYPAGYQIKQSNIYAKPSYINYAGYSGMIDLGGYNCRHHNGWISTELAYAMRPELKLTDDKAKAVMSAARASDGEMRAIRTDIINKHGVTATEINYKGIDSMIRKANDKYGGDFSDIKDSIRMTFISDKDKMDAVRNDLTNLNNLTKVDDTSIPTPLGYTGFSVNLRFENGIIGEIQLNTPKMIFAKEAPEDAIRILGKDVWNAIAKETGEEGGLGHIYYEQWRKLSEKEDMKEIERLFKRSTEYYNKFRD